LWTRTLGGAEVDYAYAVSQTFPDSGYIIGGSTRSFGAGSYDAYLIKTDPGGGLLWTRTFGGTAYDDARSVQQTTPDSGYVIAGSTRSSGAGIYDVYLMRTEPVLAGVYGTELPDDGLAICSAGPNPFRDVASIRYRLARPGNVCIGVYDLLGRRVIELVNQQQEAGVHSVTWDGATSEGRKATSGLYLLRFETQERASTRKLLLIR
jgi:hypothetical protein